MRRKYNFHLNKESIKELREKLDELLDTIEFDPNNRIPIPLETLNLIMFDNISKKGYKRVGFHSKNLCKIDLSKLSFKNVTLGDAGLKNFDNTNINLDFKELLKDGFMHENNLYFLNLSLINVDLTENDFCDLNCDNVYFINCNLSNTGLSITDYDQYPNPNIQFDNCNLTGMDLSWITMPLVDVTSNSDVVIANCNTSFKGINNYYGTKISFKLDKNEDLSWLKKDAYGISKIYRFKGCYFNSYGGNCTYIRTDEENKENISNINRNYKYFVNREEKKIIDIITKCCENRYNPDFKMPKYDTSRFSLKLNKESKDRIRGKVSALIESSHFDPHARIKIPNNLLEDLLFDYHYDANGVFYKKIGFVSNNISKFDFTEVDFEDVSLDYAKEFKENGSRIFLADANAKIDFTKTYEYKTGQVVYVRYADLGGLDLSNNNFKAFKKEKIVFTSCDLRNTNLKVLEESNVNFLMCDLVGNDFSNITLDLYNMRSCKNADLCFETCNLTNTKINLYGGLNYSEDLFKEAYRNYPGCYLNGKRIKYNIEIVMEKDEILEKYKKYSDNKISRTLSLVRKQINGKKEGE